MKETDTANILIVEVDVSIRMMIKMHISLVVYDAFEADDATEVREILIMDTIDLAVFDIILLREDGYLSGRD